MIDKNKITEAKLVSSIESLNQTHLTPADVVSAVLVLVVLLLR